MSDRKGFFISVEGGDGVGKSTQLSRIKDYLKKRGFDTVFTREPGGTEIGEKIRSVILDVENREMEDHTEAYLYAASRAQVVRQVIAPALREGKVVVCDRFVDSSIAYQGYGRGLGKEIVWSINRDAVSGCMPDLTIYLDLEPDKANKRMEERDRKLDRLEESGESFHQKVHAGYQELIDLQNRGEPPYGDFAGGERIVPIRADLPPEEVWEKIRTLLEERLEDYRG